MGTLIDWKDKLIGKMKAENIRDLSDSEINRVFAGCVAETNCIKYAHELINAGMLTVNEVI
jgi:hypothetical protein